MVHLIPVAFCFSAYLANWLAQPTMAQNRPVEASPSKRQGHPILETIRGGRHQDYASIVFQFSDRILFHEPAVNGRELHLAFPNVVTQLPPFRRYKTFDSWLKIETADDGLLIRIGLPKGFVETRAFLMDNPHRLVINLYDRPGQAGLEPRLPAPRLRISIPYRKSPLRAPSPPPTAAAPVPKDPPGHPLSENSLLKGVQGEGPLPTLGSIQTPGHSGGSAGGLEIQGGDRGGGIKTASGGVGSTSSRYRIQITPKISVKGEYDDNIFLYKYDKMSDYITTVSPGVLVYMDSGRNGLELEYTFGWVRYHDLSENDYVRHDGRLKFWQRLSRRLTFNVSDSYIRSNDLLDQDLAPDLRTQRIRHTARPYERNDFNTSLDYVFGPESRLSAGYRHGYLNNEDPDVEDVVEHSPYARLFYWITGKDGLELAYDYRRFDYTLNKGYGPGRADLDAHDVDAAYRRRFSRRAAIHVRYGFANRNFKGVPISYHIHEVGVGCEYAFSKSMSLALDIGYFRPSGIDIDPGIEYTGRFEKRFRRGRAFVSALSGWDEGFMDVEPRAFTRYWGGDAGIDYEPVQDLKAYLGLDYRKNDYAFQEEDDDDTFGGRCGVRYRFLGWFSADLGYSHRRRISDDPNNEYRDNRITLTITAAKPHPYQWEL